MRAKLVLVIFCVLILAQGCMPTNLEGSKMEEKIYKISDFSKIEIGMTYDEVIRLIGEPTDSIGSGIVWERYKLDEGWYVELLFWGENETLLNIQIVGPNKKEFVLKRDE